MHVISIRMKWVNRHDQYKNMQPCLQHWQLVETQVVLSQSFNEILRSSSVADNLVRITGVYLCSGVQFYLLLSPYLCFISFLYLDLYVLGDDALISWGSLMQTNHPCVLIHI